MANKVFIPKEDPGVPDFYKVAVTFVTGKKEEFKVVSHSYLKDTQALEIVLFDDLFVVLPYTNMLKVEYDRAFTKLMEVRTKLAKMGPTQSAEPVVEAPKEA